MGHHCRYRIHQVKCKDNRGWYRDFCADCAQRVADGEDLRKKFDTDTGERL